MKTTKNTSSVLSPLEKEVKRLHAIGKAPDIIALRLGVKISKILMIMQKA
jgi:DNA-binding CsgD family transcriptional regulator